MASWTLLGSTFNTSTGGHTVAAVPAVGDLIILVVAETGIASDPTPTDDNSSGTYTKLHSAVKASSADQVSVWARTAAIAAGSVTNFSDGIGASTGGGLAVLKIASWGGSFGSSAMRSISGTGQKGKEDNQTVGSAGPSYPAAPLTGNPQIGALFTNANATSGVAPVGWTEQVGTGYNTPTTGIEVVTVNSGQTSQTVSWSSNVGTQYCDVIVELSAPGPPVNTVAPAVTGTTTVGQTLTSGTGTWTNDGTPVYTYQWQRDNSGGAVYSNIAAATASTRVLTNSDDGCHVRCVVTNTDSGGATSANSNAVGTVIEPLAVNTVAPAVTGRGQPTYVLSCDTGTWTGLGGLNATLSYQWQDSANGTTGWANLAGQTATSYTITSGELSRYIRCNVTAHNTNPTAVTAASNTVGPILGPSRWAFSFQWGSQYQGVIGPALFDTLSSLTINTYDSNSIWTGDDAINAVQKYTSAGVYVTQLDLAKNHDVHAVYARATNGDVYTAANTQYQVQRFNSAGVFQNAVGTHGTGNGQFNEVAWVRVSPDGTQVLAGDSNLNRIQEFTAALVFVKVWATSVTYMEFAPDGTVWTIDGKHRNSDGTVIATVGTIPSGYIAIDDASDYKLYFGQTNYIQVTDQTFATVDYIGVPGSGQGQFSRIQDLSVRAGKLYIADENNYCVQCWVQGAPLETVAWSWDGNKTLVATLSNTVIGQAYYLITTAPGSSIATSTATSTSLVLTVSDATGLATGRAFDAQVGFGAGSGDPGDIIAADAFQVGLPGEYGYNATWAYNGLKTVTCTFVGASGVDYYINVFGSDGSTTASATTAGTGASMTLSATPSVALIGNYLAATLYRVDSSVATTCAIRLFQASTASTGVAGNPANTIITPDSGGGSLTLTPVTPTSA